MGIETMRMTVVDRNSLRGRVTGESCGVVFWSAQIDTDSLGSGEST